MTNFYFYNLFSIDGDSHDGHDHELPPHYEDSQLAAFIDPVNNNFNNNRNNSKHITDVKRL